MQMSPQNSVMQQLQPVVSRLYILAVGEDQSNMHVGINSSVAHVLPEEDIDRYLRHY